MNVEAVLQKTDLLELAERAGARFHKAGPEYRSRCPLHGGHNETGFAVYQKNGRQLWHCFSGDCGGGDAITFVQVWRGWDFKRAYEFLGGDTQYDPVEMKRLADERMERARKELEEKQQRLEAARRELQVAEKHLYYHQHMPEWGRQKWLERGLDEGMQDFFLLGACDDFVVGDGYHTPTLTIPFLDEQRQLLHIKHRLLNPQKPNDKYRPERVGLGAFPPFLAIPEMGYDGGLIIVTEGEIKAMVTWASLSEPDIQVIGVPGRTQFKILLEHLGGKNVVVIPDPGAEHDAYDFAKQIKARYLPMPEKIDDYILSAGMKPNDVYAIIRQARRV
jgi:hypothetical protein